MTATQLIVVAIIALPLLGAFLNRLRVDIAALMIAVGLGLAQFFGLGVLGEAGDMVAVRESVAGFGQPVVITLLSLFIVTNALDRTGVTRWLADRILTLGGGSESRLIVLFAASAAAFSLIMNNVAAGAFLLPGAVDAARKSGIRPSKLLMPMAFGTLLGGMSTYFTTANIIMDDLLREVTDGAFNLEFLDFTPTGGLMTTLGIAFLAIFARRLLPDRQPMSEQFADEQSDNPNARLDQTYGIDERIWEAKIRPESALVGKTLAESRIGADLGLSVMAIQRGRQQIDSPVAEVILLAGDVLAVIGREERVERLRNLGVTVTSEAGTWVTERELPMIEVVLSPHSTVEGYTLKQIDFRQRFGFTALALWRDGRSYRTDVGDFPLRLGDAFLLTGSRDGLPKLQYNRNFIVLESNFSRAALKPRRAGIAVAITAIAVLVSIIGLPVYLAMLAAAIVIVLTGILTMEDAYRAVEWQAIFLVAGMYSVSLAMVQTGLADMLATSMLALVTPLGALGVAVGAYLLSALLTQVMGGQVTALVTGPIALSAALTLGVNPQAVAVATAVGCSASFLTPIAHPVNILVVPAGNYQLRDFLRLGIPMFIVSLIGLTIAMALFWGLSF